MAERKPAQTRTQQSARRTNGKASDGFSDEERATIRIGALLKRAVI